MTIYKHVFKKNTVSPTLSVSAVVHFYSVSTVHIWRPEKTQMSMTRKYHNHTLQTKTRPDIIVHFYKTTESIPFRMQIVCAKMCVRVSTFCPQYCRTARERFCCLLCWGDTLQVETSILLMGDVAYDACFSVCNKRNTLRYSNRT